MDQSNYFFPVPFFYWLSSAKMKPMSTIYRALPLRAIKI